MIELKRYNGFWQVFINGKVIPEQLIEWPRISNNKLEVRVFVKDGNEPDTDHFPIHYKQIEAIDKRLDMVTFYFNTYTMSRTDKFIIWFYELLRH